MAIIEKATLSFNYIDQSRVDHVRRMVESLFSVKEGTLPMDRSFGLNYDFSNQPIPVAQNLYVLEITKKVEMYIADIKIESVNWEYDLEEGKMYPTILFTKK